MGILKLIDGLADTDAGLCGAVSEGFLLRVDLLEDWLLRIALVPEDGLVVDRSWMVAPNSSADLDGPVEGRDRLALDGFSRPGFRRLEAGIEGRMLRVRVTGDPLRLVVEQRSGVQGSEEAWQVLYEDRENGAYQWFEKSARLKHFQHLPDGEAHYGLGDKSGSLDRTGRRLRCLQSDALGYDAETSDPLYKHAPFVIASQPVRSFGLFYDTMSEITFDLGAEHSNYFRRFRHVETAEKGMVLYVLAGPQLKDVVPRLHRLTGQVAFPPRWSMGFAFTTMHHADHPQAQQVITSFAKEARDRGLPISAIHLGSGYTAGKDGLRYVFNWNTDRFPDRTQFFNGLRAMGYRTCANVKPVLLTGHASFDEARSQGWFVRGGDGDAAIEMFWGGWGASLDFTNPDTCAWWGEGISRQVLQAGFDAVWNDNNECELWDEGATVAGFGDRLPGMDMRPVHALLMTRTSHAAMVRYRPMERPYTISRAGPIGIARYGETWSGDNRTSWHTLKWNLRQGLSMALSGMPLTGHDIGGFDGPPPGPELLLRWFQMMALHPRCVMNSWKAQYDNIPNLPWMHEAVFEGIKSALKLRYRFLPLIYALAWRCHTSGQPIIAPLLYHHDDPECRKEESCFMLGPDVLVAPVVDEGARERRLYLPQTGTPWVRFGQGEIVQGGQWVTVDAPLEELPIFVRQGAVLPLARDWPQEAPHDPTAINLTVFADAARTGTYPVQLYWDDGLTRTLEAPLDARIIVEGGKAQLAEETPLSALFDVALA